MYRNVLMSSALALAVALGTSAAHAATYGVNLNVGAGNVSGFIETDDTTGILATANITNYSLTLTSPNLTDGSGDAITFANNFLLIVSGTGFTASLTELSFDFLSTSVVIFLGGPFNNFFCLDGIFNNCSDSGDSTASIGYRPVVTFSDAVAFQGTAVIGRVDGQVPLPASLPLALVGFGILGWLGRRRNRSV